MNRIALKKSTLAAVALVAALHLPARADEAPAGPTPYPSAKDEAAWPGKGPIRTFGWMIQERTKFWKKREADQGAVVFAGDSNTAGWKAENMAKAFPELKTANRGVGGDTSRGLLFRFKEDVLDLHPKAIVILIGGNDLTAHGNPSAAESNITEMINQARAQRSDVPIVVCQLTPRDSKDAPLKPGAHKDLNERIAGLSGKFEKLVVIDLFTPMAQPDGKPLPECVGKDGVHLALPGYAKWAEQLRPALQQLGVL